MEKNLIVFLNIRDEFEEYSESIESIRAAANRWKADVYEITNCKYPSLVKNLNTLFFWNRVWIMENFISYDKVLIVDTDIIINSNAPNIFTLLTQDIAGVLDGNPGRLVNDFFKNRYLKNIAFEGNTSSVFSCIKNFNVDKYWDNYINMGVFLFNPKTIYNQIQHLKDWVFNNTTIWDYLYSNVGFTEQNLFNAWLSSLDINIQILDNKWNWIAPDATGFGGSPVDQWDPSTEELVIWDQLNSPAPNYTNNFHVGKMYPYIYHFCGTNEAKQALKYYKKWR